MDPKKKRPDYVEEELDSSPHLSHYSQLRNSCGCPGVSSGGGLFISFHCGQLKYVMDRRALTMMTASAQSYLRTNSHNEIKSWLNDFQGKYVKCHLSEWRYMTDASPHYS